MKRVSSLEYRLVKQVLRSSFRGSKSTNMRAQLEKEFARLSGCSENLACVNGTATLHIALEALGVGVGDEVIVPALTMSATCFAVLHANATPIFADVDPLTWQISADSVARLITPQTKAIMTVALYGGSPDYDALRLVAPGIPIIEDNAEAIGTAYKGRIIGSMGDFSSYSFQSSKHLTAGEGGMLCTNNPELAEQARLVQTLGYTAVKNKETRKIPKAVIQNPSYKRHESLGWNYRMAEISAAVALGQVKRSDKLVAIRTRAAQELGSIVETCDWLVPQSDTPETTSSFWSYAVLLTREDVSWQEFVTSFNSNGGKGIYAAWALGYQEPAFANLNLLGREKLLTRSADEIFSDGTCPISEKLQPRILAFRTNEWTVRGLREQATALRKTIQQFP